MGRSLDIARALLGQSVNYPVAQSAGYLLFLLAAVGWSWSLRRRIVHAPLRYALWAAVAVLFVWVALRGAQFLSAYSVHLAQTQQVVYLSRQVALLRASWEVSWLAFALLPSLGLRVLKAARSPAHSVAGTLLHLHAAISIALWAGRFVPALRPFASACIGWWILLSALAFVLGFCVCSLSAPFSPKRLIPTALLLAFAAYCVFFFRIRPAWASESNFIFTVALFVFILLESCLRTGLVPCNSLHEAFFAHCPVKMELLDTDGQIAWKSAATPAAGDVITRTQPLAGGGGRCAGKRTYQSSPHCTRG